MGIEQMRTIQENAHGAGHDYVVGSPHLEHPALRRWVTASIVDAVRSLGGADGPRVLEIGAGHGPMTERLVEAGARVVVTEMSRPSTAALRARFRGTAAVEVVDDPDGSLPVPGSFDAVLFVSVLHHIPDYVASVRTATGRLRPGGALISFQDPLWYPRMSRRALLASRATYAAWRLTRGDYRRGVATTIRRLRGRQDESQPSDMVEYHAMRQGVDEQALRDLLEPRFESVRVEPYWSTQSAWGQRIGDRLFPPNTFGLVATGWRGAS